VVKLVGHYPVKKRVVRGLANITGGGLPDNVARILPPGRRGVVRGGAGAGAPGGGGVEELGSGGAAEMYRVFNMGIGFAVIASPHFAESIVKQLAEDRVPAWVIGEVRDGEPGVELV